MIDEESLNDSLDDSIDLTPMLDVVFLLLIFFIMATTFSRPVLNVVLPDAESSQQQQPGGREMVIAVDAAGRVLHNDREIDAAELDALLESSPELKLNFHVDQNAPFEAFIRVLDAAKAKGREDFAITTRHASRD